jgi:uroporphyrinogen-III decarboxylase
MSQRNDFEKVVDIILNEADFNAIEKGKERQSAIWENREPDYLPLILSDWDTPELKGFKHWTLKEQFYDKEKMLLEQLKGLVGIAKTHSDAQLSIRVNMGVGIIPSVFGLQPVFPQDDQMPWFVGNLSKEEILRLGMPSDIRERGLMPFVIEYLQYFKSVLPEGIHIYCFDTQGPFDIAHLIRGHQIYFDLYDDPEFAHYLLDISTQLYIEATKIFKEIVGEPLDSGYHGTLYMSGGGVRLCDDSSVNLSPSLFREFSLPYIKRALAPFGGGWVHFCGDGNHLLDMYLELEEVKGLNFGNPEKYDYERTIEKITSKGKFYVGYIPRKDGESLRDYFERILSPLKSRKGLILQMNRGEEGVPETLDLWRSLQDELFSR